MGSPHGPTRVASRLAFFDRQQRRIESGVVVAVE